MARQPAASRTPFPQPAETPQAPTPPLFRCPAKYENPSARPLFPQLRKARETDPVPNFAPPRPCRHSGRHTAVPAGRLPGAPAYGCHIRIRAEKLSFFCPAFCLKANISYLNVSNIHRSTVLQERYILPTFATAIQATRL